MDAQWLKVQFRLHPEKSKADLARVLGLEPSAVSKILSEGRQIKAHEYIAMRHFFGLPVDGEKSLSLPGSKDRLAKGLGDRDQAEWLVRAYVPRLASQGISDQLRVFRIEEAVMEPDYLLGDHVLVDTSLRNPQDSGVFVVCDGFTYMVRDCACVNGKVRVSARQKDFQVQILGRDEILLMGRVVGKIQWS
jgi:transcriptional regulator with XRE-family HTH domain